MINELLGLWQSSPVVIMKHYRYVVHPITDGIPYIAPTLLNKVVNSIIRKANLNVDYVVVPETMGIPLGTLLSYKTKIPLNIIRKKCYKLKGELVIKQKTAYKSAKMYLNGLRKGNRVLIVDDIISTGGTLLGIIKVMEKAGIKIIDIITVLERGEGKKQVEKETGYKIKTLQKVMAR